MKTRAIEFSRHVYNNHIHICVHKELNPAFQFGKRERTSDLFTSKSHFNFANSETNYVPKIHYITFINLYVLLFILYINLYHIYLI